MLQVPNIVPIGERILIELGAEIAGSDFANGKGLIVVPEASRKQFTRLGTVVALGPKADTELKPGDPVVCWHTVGVPLKQGDREFVFLKAEHVAGRVEPQMDTD